MTLKELFEKYCALSKWGYVCNGHCVELTPASEEEIKAFRTICDKYGVEESLFEWWDDDQKCIWFGCVDDNSFIYDANTHKYAIGEAGSNDFGEYDTFMEMLEAYLKYGYELGANC